MNQGNKKYSYYVNFTTEMFLAAKELLKSMPAFYNKVYFSSKFASALWSGDKEEMYTNVTLLIEAENMETIRKIIKANFLYIGDWDSIKFTEKGDYGFSFIAGNIKYIVLSFAETENGYHIRSYDADTGDCYDTDMIVDKKFFLDVSMKENGEFIRTCDFNLEYINDQNSKKFRAEKKALPQMVTINTNGGYAMTNMYLIMLITLASMLMVWLAYITVK